MQKATPVDGLQIPGIKDLARLRVLLGRGEGRGAYDAGNMPGQARVPRPYRTRWVSMSGSFLCPNTAEKFTKAHERHIRDK